MLNYKREFFCEDVETGYIDNNAVDGHTWRFIKIWKELCEDENVVEVCRQSVFVTYHVLLM